MRSKGLDWERLQELCQPKKPSKGEEKEVEPPKAPKVFTEEELTR